MGFHITVYIQGNLKLKVCFPGGVFWLLMYVVIPEEFWPIKQPPMSTRTRNLCLKNINKNQFHLTSLLRPWGSWTSNFIVPGLLQFLGKFKQRCFFPSKIHNNTDKITSLSIQKTKSIFTVQSLLRDIISQITIQQKSRKYCFQLMKVKCGT